MNTLIDLKKKGLELYNQRVQDLLADGYHVVVKFNGFSLCMVKLRHHNGNHITIKFHIQDGIITQYTNSIKVYSNKVY